ncbi:MAG: hypothetical protein GY702_00405 [Desulfobulbaceae bacterium]|nr:hypothetical protein [Desulfobulbaceae bacterium]
MLLNQQTHTSLVEVESPLKILVVDDNTVNIDVMLSFLEVEGYEACRRLKKQPATQTIPIIFVTVKKRSRCRIFPWYLYGVRCEALPCF